MRFVWPSILAVATSVYGACNTIQAETDFQGNDLDMVAANSAGECCAPCQENPLCTGFSFTGGVCYLKFGQLTRVAKAGVSTGTVQPSQCLPWEENVDYYGDDLAKDTSITTPGECCDLCAANPACKLYVVSIYGCTLKTAGSDRRPDQDPSWNVKAAFVRSSQDASQCGTVESNVDYPGNDIQRYPDVTDPDQCCSLCTQNANCKLFVSSIFGCSLKSAGGSPSSNLDPAWNVRAAFKESSQSNGQCGTVESNVDYPGNDIQRYPDVTDADECCALCSRNSACKLFVSSIFGCSLKSAGQNPVKNQDPSWNVRAAFVNATFSSPSSPSNLEDDSYSPDVRVTAVKFTTMGGSQWIPDATESTKDDLQALVKALNISLSTHKHGVKPETIITKSSDGSMVLPFTSVDSVGECAALIKSHDQTFFTYLDDSGICLGHSFTTTDGSFALTAKGTTIEIGDSPADNFIIDTPSASNVNDCITQCQLATNCVTSKFTDKCYLYAPAQASSNDVVAGWVTSDFDANPVANLPTFSNPTKVAFYIVAHEDDHELFMSNNYHVSISDSKTKVVFVYTTAGDASSGDAWRQARELGTLAATKAWVDHVGKFKSDPTSDTVSVNGHDVARVTIGNCVHYFLRVPEYGADGSSGFMALVNNQKPIAPMDDPTNVYENRDDFKASLAEIIGNEADGISDIEMNAQDPEGEQPDHDMHLATGALVSDIMSENSQWNICVPQKYFYDYQTWFDDINVTPTVEKLQRYAWLRLSEAIHAMDETAIFWSEHSINLGRTYIRRTVNEDAGSC
ncbi:hypothetical protein LEN26_000741 [Aphanomyces euteiches]|nr:hypothetical protein LEN26_000741 [Aphanomyces euteiches]KAH9182832.1 hypothetical protein AeNC1_015192 [Aphanomyces euteiches]